MKYKNIKCVAERVIACFKNKFKNGSDACMFKAAFNDDDDDPLVTK